MGDDARAPSLYGSTIVTPVAVVKEDHLVPFNLAVLLELAKMGRFVRAQLARPSDLQVSDEPF